MRKLNIILYCYIIIMTIVLWNINNKVTVQNVKHVTKGKYSEVSKKFPLEDKSKECGYLGNTIVCIKDSSKYVYTKSVIPFIYKDKKIISSKKYMFKNEK